MGTQIGKISMYASQSLFWIGDLTSVDLNKKYEMKSVTGYFWHVCVAVDIWIYIFIYYKYLFCHVILLF